MKDSTYQNKKRGLGPVLVPRGMQSRFITNLKAEWVNVEDFAMLTLRYVNIVNKKGQSFAQYHLTGTRRGLPKRDVGGVTPRGMSKIRARISQWAQDIKKGKR
jgi:hypothetical protein